MATTGFWPVKNRLKEVIDYARNPDKTTDKKFLDEDLYAALRYVEDDKKTDRTMYVSGINCPKQRAYQCMMATKQRYGKLGGNVAYHGYQSFVSGEVTPEEAHRIGLETARRMWGKDYEIVVTTHLNTVNLHNHIVINSVSFRTGRKFENHISDHYKLREISDEICREHGKFVLAQSKFNGSRKKDYWIHKSGGFTHRDILKRDIDEAISKTTNGKAFELYLKSLGYSYARNSDYRHPSIIAPGWKRPVRIDSLGEQYTQEKIWGRLISNQQDITLYAIRIPKRHTPLSQLEYEFEKVRRMDGIQLAFALIIELWKLITGNNIEPSSPKPLSPTLRQEVRKLDQTLKECKLLCENQIASAISAAVWIYEIAGKQKKWIIDPEAAEIVKSIFKMCLDGKGNETIARILQEQKILIPMAYWQSKELPRGGKKTQSNPYKWCKTTIQKILSQQEYCGDIINFKTYSKSFKNKTRLENPQENWAVFKNVHEPIIDREAFEQVQKLIAKTKRRAPKSSNAQKSIFCDLLYCGDCHKKLRHHTNTINKDIHYFVCSNNKVNYRGNCPGRHYVRADAVEQVVMLELRRMAEFLHDDEQAFADILAQKSDAELMKEQKRNEGELQKAIVRNDTVSRLYEKLYEDNATGKVSDEWFMQLSHKYEVERMELKAKIADLRSKLMQSDEQQKDRENSTAAVRRFIQMEHLTAPLLRELIDHIDVLKRRALVKTAPSGLSFTIAS